MELEHLSEEEVREIARQSVEIQMATLADLGNHIDNRFVAVVRTLAGCGGRVVVTGIGKSALIAQKMVATFNSTGTPSMFLHAADAVHGDLGMVQAGDVVICISKSGNSPEIKALVPLLIGRKIPVFGMTANTGSFLAREATEILFTPVKQEACPNNLAPTSSTTSQLVLGDALAVTLIRMRRFTEKDFARYHPGGALGKKLYLRLADLLRADGDPKVSVDTPVEEVILEISRKRLGAAVVLEEERIVGMITDGDLRRMLQNPADWQHKKAGDIMSGNPKTMHQNELAYRAFELMENHHITQVVVVNDNGYAGLVHLHDILKEGIF